LWVLWVSAVISVCLAVLATAIAAGEVRAADKPGLASGGKGKPSGMVWIDGAVAAQRGELTELRLRSSSRVVPKVSTLAAPYRVIMDFPKTSFRLQPSAGRTGGGLISAFRYGLLTPLASRLVVDATGPFSIRALRILERQDGRTNLILEMVPVRAADFVPQGQAPEQPPPVAMRKGQYDHATREARTLPVIVIDPGHGGPDPGAIGPGNTFEKVIALEVGKRLRKELAATGRYRIVMTRTRDIFVSLADRVQLSQNVAADLFLSLHADATPEAAGQIRGASIYTLSRQASDRQAQLFAQKENASDVLSGFAIPPEGAGDGVENILIDLLNRETQVFSFRAREALIDKLDGKIKLSREPRRAAAFKVLKQTGTPSVLIELGYISNPHDEQEMRTQAWQNNVAGAIARAVDTFFQRKRSVMR
jgi:N-acetylmuramoyl-L-alanine amidase